MASSKAWVWQIKNKKAYIPKAYYATTILGSIIGIRLKANILYSL
jgi:hypothetical protein